LHLIVGDSFPTSLRYYDLRLRYSTQVARAAAEQDLGRACRWDKVDSDKLPIILVSKYLYDQLKTGRGGRKGLLQCPPDPDKMYLQKGQLDGSAVPKGSDEFATECYRKSWRIRKDRHFDSGGKGVDGWCDNPRRFLLFGRPQIGKTGVFHHLSYLLWEKIEGQAAESADPFIFLVDPIRDSDNSDSDTDPDCPPDAPEDPEAFTTLPKSSYVAKLKFRGRDKLHPGKYGPPGEKALWDWCVMHILSPFSTCACSCGTRRVFSLPFLGPHLSEQCHLLWYVGHTLKYLG
jgi:hypothetical protein